MNKRENKNTLLIIMILLLTVVVYGGYKFWQTSEILKITRAKLATTTAELLAAKSENKTLGELLETERYINSTFDNKIKEIAGTVGTLDKLSKTDKELLQKYSKVYFLNEHYVPDSLATITPEHLFQEDRPQRIHSKVSPFLERLMKDARNSGSELKIISAYRSFGEQSTLKGGYTFVYGSGANKFSADQGYSEHQLGTALDFTTTESGTDFNGFKNTAAYKWLLENAYKYGFTLSYPENNSYYQFEPWHWRFVGVELAGRLQSEKAYFYDLDQRTIDSYLINIFD